MPAALRKRAPSSGPCAPCSKSGPCQHEVGLERVPRRPAKERDALLATLAHDAHLSVRQVERHERGRSQLSHPQAARVGRLEQGPIAQGERGAAVRIATVARIGDRPDSIEQILDLTDLEHGGQASRAPWRGDRRPRVALDPALAPGVAVEGAERRHPSRDRGPAQATGVELGQIAAQDQTTGAPPVRPGPGCQPLEVGTDRADVGALRVLRSVARPERAEETLERVGARHAEPAARARVDRRAAGLRVPPRRGAVPFLPPLPRAVRGRWSAAGSGAPPARRSPTGSRPSGLSMGAPHFRHSQASPRAATGPSSASWIAPIGVSLVV